MISDLVEFLNARLDEDEAAANDVRPDEYLSTRDNSRLTTLGFDIQPYRTVGITSGRVLAEVDSKRRILRWAVKYTKEDFAPWNDECLRLLALPYADHPDYRQEWRP